MTQLTYTNIFEAITEDKAKAANLQFRADLILVIRQIIESKDWRLDDIASGLGVSQSRVGELTNGEIDKFSSGKLIEFISVLGFTFRPEFKYFVSSEPELTCAVISAD